MKYLYEDAGTNAIFDDQSCTKIGYFFHELGESQEKSFSGLLASLLNQLLTTYNSLAPQPLRIFNDLKRKRKRQSQEPLWNEYNLKKVLESIRLSNAIGVVMLFIDGLDECSGDHRKQLDFLIPWITSTQGSDFRIRMCIASRPLEEIKFRLSIFPECKIHEWTANDIRKYVSDRLGYTWENLQTSHRKCYADESNVHWIEEIVRKAHGVFLWVEVVVNNLTIGIEEGSTYQELTAALGTLPGELENLYHKIINQIPKSYVPEAYRYLSLILLWATSLRTRRVEKGYKRGAMGLLDFYLATRGAEKVIERNSQHSREHHLQLRDACLLTEIRIRSRCRGLLQLTEDPRNLILDDKPQLSDDAMILVPVLMKTVDFFHLSIREYLEKFNIVDSSSSSKEMELLMAASVGLLKLVPSAQLFQCRVGTLTYGLSDRNFSSVVDTDTQSDPEQPDRSSSSDWSPIGEYTRDADRDRYRRGIIGWRPINDFFCFARRAQVNHSSYGGQLLVELDRLCRLAIQSWCQEYLMYALQIHHDSHFSFSFMHCVFGHPTIRTADLFCVCLAFGLDSYVQEELQRSQYLFKQRIGLPLLHYLFFLCNFRGELPSLETLRMLLEHGERPNEEYAGQTHWEFAIRAVEFAVEYNHGAPDSWPSVPLLLVEYGADPIQSLNQIYRGKIHDVVSGRTSLKPPNTTGFRRGTLEVLQGLVKRERRPSSQLSQLRKFVETSIEKMITLSKAPLEGS